MYITTADELAAFCERAREARLVAVDTEFIRERSYYPQLCLVQLATADETAIVDPIALKELTPLADLMSDERVTKVFHACEQDLIVFWYVLGVMCAPVFDTQVAAAFCGMRQQASYADLVAEFCGVRLAKAEALSDWSVRPLTAEQLTYAADDVSYLPGIYEQMSAHLLKQDRLGWVLPEMEAISERVRQDMDPRCAYLHLKRLGTLTRRQQAIAREACAWREEAASAHDIPRRWLINDEVLVECCRRVPKGVDDLRRIRGAEKLRRDDAAGLLRALRRGAHASTEGLGQTHNRRKVTGEGEGVVDLMYAVVRVTSKECGIAPQLLASRDDLNDLLAGRCDAALRHGWRHEVVGERLERLLAGELALTVRKGRIEVL